MKTYSLVFYNRTEKEYAEAFLNHVKEKLNLTDVYIIA